MMLTMQAALAAMMLLPAAYALARQITPGATVPVNRDGLPRR